VLFFLFRVTSKKIIDAAEPRVFYLWRQKHNSARLLFCQAAFRDHFFLHVFIKTMQSFRHLYRALADYGCDLSTMPREMGTQDEVDYATEYLRQRVRSLAVDALQRKDLSSHEEWLAVLQGPQKGSEREKKSLRSF
jgi:hypothetical protein